MNKEVKMALWKSRAKLLESRGPHNAKIVNKLKRKMRKIEEED